MFVLVRMVVHVLIGAVVGTTLATLYHAICDAWQRLPAVPDKQSPQWVVVVATLIGVRVVPCNTRRGAEKYCSSLASKRVLVDMRKGCVIVNGVKWQWREVLWFGYNPFYSNDCMRRALLAHLQRP
jgi:hypothetical protein